VEGRQGAEAVVRAVAAEFGVEPEVLRSRQYDCVARGAAARMLVRYAGLNQRDAGVFLGMGTGASVCRQLKRLREKEGHDQRLAAQLSRVSSVLAGPTGRA
jgi:hypothetical protein